LAANERKSTQITIRPPPPNAGLFAMGMVSIHLRPFAFICGKNSFGGSLGAA
jgi:hypothetical protein